MNKANNDSNETVMREKSHLPSTEKHTVDPFETEAEEFLQLVEGLRELAIIAKLKKIQPPRTIH